VFKYIIYIFLFRFNNIPYSLDVQQAVLHYLGLCKYTFAPLRNRLTTRFSERIPVVMRRLSVTLKRCDQSATEVAVFSQEGV
jgi:hypothetical protein